MYSGRGISLPRPTRPLQKFGIVYLLPKEARDYHEKLCLEIEKEFGLTGNTQFTSPSHITMKYRFASPNIRAVQGILDDFTRSQAKTAWSLDGFAHFVHPGNRVIFIDVKPSPATRLAHARLLGQLKQLDWMEWNSFDGDNLHYHVTVANQGLTAQNFDAVWQFVKQKQRPRFDLCLDNLTLLKIEAEHHTVYRRYRFRS